MLSLEITHVLHFGSFTLKPKVLSFILSPASLRSAKFKLQAICIVFPVFIWFLVNLRPLFYDIFCVFPVGQMQVVIMEVLLVALVHDPCTYFIVMKKTINPPNINICDLFSS